MDASPNLKPTCTLLPWRTSWSSIQYSTQFPFSLQTQDIPNLMHWATNSGYTKPRACILTPLALHIPNSMPTLNQSTVTSLQKGHHDTSMAQAHHFLNNQKLATFVPSTTAVTTLHYSEFTNKYSTQNGRWSFFLYFMTNILFSTFLLPLPPSLSATKPIQSASQPPSLPTTPLPFSNHPPHFSALYHKAETQNWSVLNSSGIFSAAW